MAWNACWFLKLGKCCASPAEPRARQTRQQIKSAFPGLVYPYQPKFPPLAYGSGFPAWRLRAAALLSKKCNVIQKMKHG